MHFYKYWWWWYLWNKKIKPHGQGFFKREEIFFEFLESAASIGSFFGRTEAKLLIYLPKYIMYIIQGRHEPRQLPYLDFAKSNMMAASATQRHKHWWYGCLACLKHCGGPVIDTLKKPHDLTNINKSKDINHMDWPFFKREEDFLWIFSISSKHSQLFWQNGRPRSWFMRQGCELRIFYTHLWRS